MNLLRYLSAREWTESRANSSVVKGMGLHLPMVARMLEEPEDEAADQAEDAAETAAAASQDPADRTLKFVLSTPEVDRYNARILPDAWRLDAYRENPVALWCHDWCGMPLARCTQIEVDAAGKLVASAEFAPDDVNPCASMVLAAYRKKFLNAVSVGALPIECEWAKRGEDSWGVDWLAVELVEFSFCPIPVNPSSLMQRSAGAGAANSLMLEVLRRRFAAA